MAETQEEVSPNTLEKDLAKVLNEYSMDSGANTPDFVLARYLIRCLDNFREVNQERENWFGTPLRISNDNSSKPSPMEGPSEEVGNEPAS